MAGPAVWRTWERGHILRRVAVVIDAQSQGVGILDQLELEPRCLPAVGEGARKNKGAVGVEVLAVVVRGVVMSLRLFRLATDFDKQAWVCVHPVEELRSELLVDGDVW